LGISANISRIPSLQGQNEMVALFGRLSVKSSFGLGEFEKDRVLGSNSQLFGDEELCIAIFDGL